MGWLVAFPKGEPPGIVAALTADKTKTHSSGGKDLGQATRRRGDTHATATAETDSG